jgi:alkyl hydroperoxide reductase subunit D
MTLESLLESLPAYAKDLKLNLSTVLRQAELTPQQAWGTAIASAMAARNLPLFETMLTEGRQQVTPEVVDAAKAASAIMGMNNVYYRFLHLTDNEKYKTIPARLRMNVIRTHGVDPLDFELWCTAVSAINNCQACVSAHERVIRDKGITEETVAAAVRIASVVHAVAVVLDAESTGASAASAS